MTTNTWIENTRLISWLFGSVVFVLVIFPVFAHLDALPIRLWDEARNAVNAFEMSQNGQWFVTHFEGHPDLWNTKPPLLIWFQVFWIKLIGYNELAVRLPSAIAAFLTLALIFRFLKRQLQHAVFTLTPVFVLLTTSGFLGEHSGRTGDYDALLTLFTTAGAISFYRMIQTNSTKYFYLFFSMLTLGTLTKGVAGLLFLPGYFLLSIFFRRFVAILKNKHLYLGMLLFISITASYYYIRELQNPGYLKAVYENELGGRFLEVTENHKASFWYYYSNFFFRFEFWIYLVPCGFLVGYVSKNKAIKNLTLFCAIMALSFFLVISLAQTKLAWYDVPIFPFLAILTGTFINFTYDFLQKIEVDKLALNRNVLHPIFLFFIFIKPYENIIQQNYLPRDPSYDFFEFSHFLKKNAPQLYEQGENVIFYNEYRADIFFYLLKHKTAGFKVTRKKMDELRVGDVVFTGTQYWGLPHIDQVFEYEILEKHGQSVKIRLTKLLND
jgi:4-amino-4-deoxy-L-arabinose transferase-like glycosyltransferase